MITSKQKVLDLIKIAKDISKKENCSKDLREVIRMYIKTLNSLEDIINWDNGKEIVEFRRFINHWHNFKYDDMIYDNKGNKKEITNTEDLKELKFMTQIKDDINEVYKNANMGQFIYDFSKKYIKIRQNKNTNSYKLKVSDIVIINNTICNINPCFFYDSDVSCEENERREWCLNYGTEEYKKYHKWGLDPDVIREGNGHFGTLFDSLEELHKRILELGGKVYNIKDKYNIVELN